MDRPKIIIIHGFICAGKSTFSRKLSIETGFIRLNADEHCMSNFSGSELEHNWNECFSHSVDELWAQTEAEITNGNSVILDFGFWTYKSRLDAGKRAEALGADFLHYYIKVGNETINKRMNERTGAIASQNLKNFDELIKQFEEPKIDEQAQVIITD